MTDSLAIEPKAITTSGQFIAPVADLHTALMRYQMMKEFVESVLKDGVDYGSIAPGMDKPTLKKPGAEKLCSLFGLTPTFEDVATIEDWTGEFHGGEPLFYYRVRCYLWRGDVLVASADGSCNSWEKKYRYRSAERICPNCGKAAIKRSKFPPKDSPRAEPGWYCYSKAGGCGAQFRANDPAIIDQQVGLILNPDIADVVNTCLKISQKRGLVAATLIATNASEFFNQDLEDYIEGEFIEHDQPDAQAQPAPQPAAAAPRQQPPEPETPRDEAQLMTELGFEPKPTVVPNPPQAAKANAAPAPALPPVKHERPYTDPILIRIKFDEQVKFFIANNRKATKNDRTSVARWLEMCFDTTSEEKTIMRHAVTKWLIGKDSTQDFTDAELLAFKKWLNVRPDESNNWMPDKYAMAEANIIYAAAIKTNGNQAKLNI